MPRKRLNKEERRQVLLQRERQKLDEFIKTRETWWKNTKTGGRIILFFLFVAVLMIFTSLVLSIILVIRVRPFKDSISSTYSILLVRSILNALLCFVLGFAIFRAYRLQTANFQEYAEIKRLRTNTGITLFLVFLLWAGHIYLYQSQYFDRKKFVSFFKPEKTNVEDLDTLIQVFFTMDNIFMTILMILLLLLVLLMFLASPTSSFVFIF